MSAAPVPDGPNPSRSDASLDEKSLALHEREVVAKEREVELKAEELRRSRWLNPVVLGLFATAVGLTGNFIIARINNSNTQRVERLRMQSSLIIEAVKTGGQAPACNNLVFLVGLGLVDDNGTISRTCKSSINGTAQPPSLPPAGAFELTVPPEKGWCYQEKDKSGDYSAHCLSSEKLCYLSKQYSKTATACDLVSALTSVEGWRPLSGGFLNSWYQLAMAKPLPEPFPQFPPGSS